MEWETLTLTDSNDVAFLTLDRPASLNAVNEPLTNDMEEACQLIKEHTHIRVVVVAGEGRAFCSGMDLKAAAVRAPDSETAAAVWDPWQRALNSLEQMDALTIASIHGACLGAGLELALACDFRLATDNSFFSLPQVLYGAPPDTAQTYRLAHLVGIAKAKEIIILGQRFDAAQAANWGLLNKVVASEDLHRERTGLIDRCKKVSGRAAAVTKSLLNRSWTLNSSDWPEAISEARVAAFEAPDFAESMRLYRDKRKPRV